MMMMILMWGVLKAWALPTHINIHLWTARLALSPTALHFALCNTGCCALSPHCTLHCATHCRLQSPLHCTLHCATPNTLCTVLCTVQRTLYCGEHCGICTTYGNDFTTLYIWSTLIIHCANTVIWAIINVSICSERLETGCSALVVSGGSLFCTTL